MAEETEEQLDLDGILADLEGEQAEEQEAPVEEAPVEEDPVEEAPVEEAPVEEALVEEAPAEEAPVEVAPVETAPEPAPALQAAATVEANDVSDEEADIELERARNRAELKEMNAAVIAATPAPTPEEQAADIEASTDPNGWLEQLSAWTGSASDNIAEGNAKQFVDIYASTVGAVPIVANNVIEALDAAGEAMHEALPEDIQKLVASGALTGMPLVGAIASGIQLSIDNDPLTLPTYKASTVVGEVAQDIAQIAITFIPAIKGVKIATAAITGGVKFAGAAGYAVGAAEAGVATVGSEYFAWESSDATIATHLSDGANVEGQIEVFGVDINNAVLEYLSVDPDDGVLETRAKQALEGLLLGGAAGAALEGLKPLFRYGRAYVQSLELFKKGIDDAGWGGINHTPTTSGADALDSVVPASGDVPASSPTTPRPATREEQIAARDAARAADPDAPGAAPLVPADPDHAGVAVIKEELPGVPVVRVMTGASDLPVFTPKHLEDLASGARTLDDVLKEVNYGAINDLAGIRRLFTQAYDAVLMEKGIPIRGKVDVLDDTTLELEARRLNLTEDELLERRFRATAETPEFNEAAQRIVAAAEERLRLLTAAFKRGATPETALAMTRQLRISIVLKGERDALASEAARSVRISSGDTSTFTDPKLLQALDEVNADEKLWTEADHARAFEELNSEVPLGVPLSDEALSTQITLRNMGTMEDAQALADMILSTQTDAVKKALKEVPVGVFANWGELLTSYQYFAMLSQIPTHVTNVGSLIGSVVSNITERYTAEMVARSWELVGKTGKTRIAPGEGNALAAGTITGIKAAVRELVQNLRLNLFDSLDEAGNVVKARGYDYVDPKSRSTLRTELENQVGSTNRLGSRRFTGAQRGMGTVQAMFYDKIGALLNVTSVGLHTMDNFFRAITRVQETAALAQRLVDEKGLTGEAADALRRAVMEAPPSKVAVQAEKFAKESAFVEDATGLVKNINDAVRDATGNWGAVWRIGASATVPFMRTTMNLAKWAGRRSPLGYAMKSVRNDLAKGGAPATLANTRIMMGTATGTLIMGMYADDLLTGPGPTDPGERASWLLTHQPNSIKIAGEWIALEKLAPLGTIIKTWAVAAETFSYRGEDESVADAMGATLLATTQAMLDATVGPALLEVLTISESRQEGKNAKTLIADIIAKQLAPGFVRTAFKIGDDQDDIWYDTENIWEAVRAKVPWLSNEGLAPHRNIWGMPIGRSTIGPDGISPLTTGDKDPREIDNWLWDNKVGLTLPNQTISFSGMDAVELTNAEFSRYVQLAGNGIKLGSPKLGFYDYLNAVVTGQAGQASTAWNRMTDTAPDGEKGTREKWITEVVMPAYREAARLELLRTSDSLQGRRVDSNTAQVNAMNPTLNPSPNTYNDNSTGERLKFTGEQLPMIN